jgi:hypothetical protein
MLACELEDTETRAESWRLYKEIDSAIKSSAAQNNRLIIPPMGKWLAGEILGRAARVGILIV